MLEAIRQRRYLIAAVLLAAAAVLGVAYLFASKKSEPEYLSKIDRLMFERKNMAPKYILTLPDRKKIQKIEVQKIVEDGVKISSSDEKKEMPETLSMSKLMASIPLLSRLNPRTDQVPLPDIETDGTLSETIGGLKLPKISARGKKPWAEYGHKVEVAPNFYKVAVVIKNLGLDTHLTETATAVLPEEVSFSFSPYALQAAEMIKNARRRGHETYMDLLLSSSNFLKSDSGPMAMSLTASPDENLQRMRQSLSIDAPVGGMVINSGVAGEDNQETLNKILTELKERGLLMADATDAGGIDEIKIPGLARKKAEIVIEDDLSKDSIKQRLVEAEEAAILNGQVLVVAEPKPVAVMALYEWINSFSPQLTYDEIKRGAKIEKPFRLVPLSMVVVE